MTYDKLRQREHVLETLFEHPGWRMFEDLIDAQVTARRLTVFQTQIGGLDDAFGLSRNQAEVSGLMLAKQLPRFALQSIKVDIHERLEAERQEAEDNNG